MSTHQEPERFEGGFFYVTMIRDGRHAVLVGPLETQEEALEFVDRTRQIANRVDPWSAFDAFGTSQIASQRPGTINHLIYSPERYGRVA